MKFGPLPGALGFGLLLALLLGASPAAWGACSSYQGKVVFNEVHLPSSAGYLELRVLDPTVVSASGNFANWKIDLYAGDNATKQNTNVDSGYTSSSIRNRVTIDDDLNDPLVLTAPAYFKVQTLYLPIIRKK